MRKLLILSKKLNFFSLVFLLSLLYYPTQTKAQCCAAGSGSPIGGGISQGVLSDGQFEIGTNTQIVYSEKFYTGIEPAEKFLDHYSSKYSYWRFAYGLSKKLTVSLESGYWIEKTELNITKDDTMTSSGIGDLIIFPRYNVLTRTKNGNLTELTVGLGFKFPVGKYNDSVRKVEPFFNMEYYITKPIAVQPSSGANDLIMYLFFLKSYAEKDFRFFTNAIYIRKGWNPLGEKLGDYFTIGLFAGKSFFKGIGTTLQLKGEWIGQMDLNESIRMYSYPNYNPEATGSKKIFIVPQISYSLKDKIFFYCLSEIPIYQNLTKTQVGSQYQISIGLSYRFKNNNCTVDKK